MNRIYACIDLKSFYASVECKERNLDPLTTNLVVADPTRTNKTICLAISPSLKEYGLKGRARLFEVIKKVNEINKKRNINKYSKSSYNSILLKQDDTLKLDYIIAPPRMKLYITYSAFIYNIYLKYVSKDDIFVYSIDEVFMDITDYLKAKKQTAKEFITTIIHDIYNQTKITATAGIGTNLYLAKVAMDILAKHQKEDNKGVRIASLNELNYRKQLWNHIPITDFWRVGKGIANKLNTYNLKTMGDIAFCSIKNEELLYKLFGVNAEILIDHAWGWEPCTIKNIKNYKPKINSISSGQVLSKPYNYEETKIIIEEMIDLLALELTSKHKITNKIILTIDYDISNLNNNYYGKISTDQYGRKIPKHAHGTISLDYPSSSSKILTKYIIKLYNKIINKQLLTKRINISLYNIQKNTNQKIYQQLNLFEDEQLNYKETNDNQIQNTILNIKNKYGKNAILKGINLKEGATTIERNNQIGGHKA